MKQDLELLPSIPERQSREHSPSDLVAVLWSEWRRKWKEKEKEKENEKGKGKEKFSGERELERKWVKIMWRVEKMKNIII